MSDIDEGRYDGIQEMIEDELYEANQKFPAFASTHEGWAVLLEEVGEARQEMNKIDDLMQRMWGYVRNHKPSGLDPIDDSRHEADYCADLIKQHAIRGIEELIQVAAMCNKYKGLRPDDPPSPEMMRFYSEHLIDSVKPKLVHDQFEPKTYGNGKTIEIRKYGPLQKNMKPISGNDVIGLDEFGHVILKNDPDPMKVQKIKVECICKNCKLAEESPFSMWYCKKWYGLVESGGSCYSWDLDPGRVE